MNPFSQETMSLLHRAGWHEDRRIDIQEYEQILKSEGYPVHPIVRDFLTRFGGLRVVHPHWQDPQYNDEFHLNSAEAAAGISPEWVRDYSDRVGAPLCVIGEAFRSHMVLMMDPEGRVYAGYDEFLVHVGDSGPDAIEALCSGRELPEVP